MAKNVIDEKELEIAEKEAEEETSGSAYVHTMSRPFEYEGKTYNELTFDWYRLTGKDSLEIEGELSQLGKPVIAPEFSGEYLVRMAAKSCTVRIGSDVIMAMPLCDFNAIRNRARSFLLRSGR